MTWEERELARVRNPVLILSTVSWILLLAAPGGTGLHVHSHGASLNRLPNPPTAMAVNWLLMLVAMMAPVLIPPIRDIRQRSFARRRVRSISLFVAGYAAVWMAVGVAELAIVSTAGVFAAQSYLSAACTILIALVWQCSPFKQRCLNRCHAHTELAAFGAAADLDALRFGLRHGIWCAGSCWALMLIPMLLPRAHAAAMVIVSFLIFSERIESPRAPSWRWRGLRSVTRILVAQARVRLNAREAPCASAPLV
jgi:predicted metal-binding membrane protein